MADAPNQTALMKFGPIGAPVAGALLMILFVVLALMLGDTDGPKRRIDDAVSKINSRLADPKVSEPPPEFKAMGLSGANKSFGVATGGKIPAKIEKEHLLLDFPVQIKIMLDTPDTGDDFDSCDTDPKDGKLSTTEYEKTKKGKDGIKFRTLQQDNDKSYLSKVEYDSDPGAKKINYDKYDSNDDGKLSKDEYENGTRATDFDEKDVKPKDGFLSFEEFGGVAPPNKYDLDVAKDVAAAANSKDFVIVVTWTAPTLKDAPADLGYWILRRSPKDLDDRKRDYNTKDLPAWRAKADAWDKKKKDWKGPPDEFKKQFGDRPVKPPTPSEWERLNDTPVTELKFEDRTFRPDYTYTYAIRATTKADLKPGTYTDDTFAEGYHTSLPAEMTSRPVVIYNRIEMAWQAKTETTVKIKLRKYHPIGGTWRPVEVIVEVQQGEDVGGPAPWDVATMKSRQFPVSVVDTDGKANADWLKALEASKDKIDFTTGWVFNRFLGSDAELGQKGGTLRFVLPKDSKEPASAPLSDPTGMANPLAIRMSTLDKGGANVRFEITRWKQANNRWYRIVVYHDVKKGDSIGYTTAQIKELGKDMIMFFDDGGLPVSDPDKLGLREISTETDCTYAGLDKRTLDLTLGKLDLWGVYYVDK